MIEIVCPSCDARYQLPEGSIGPDGRNVSCSNCAHKWRAYVEPPAPSTRAPSAAHGAAEPNTPAPSAMPSSPALAAGSPSRTFPTRPSSGAGGPSALDPADAAAVAAAMAVAGSGSRGAAPPPAAGDRDQQMDAIRKMLADLKEGAEAADEAVPEPVAKPEAEERAQPVRRRDADEDERDTLKSRIDELTKMGKAAKGEAGQSGYDTHRLRKLHEKRAKRLQKARERRGKSGAFMTGFTLVALVVLTMVGLYVMKPQIVAASPGMAPAMDEYVVTVDRYRVQINEQTAEWRGWITERIAKLRGEEGAAEGGAAQSEQTQTQ